MPSASIDSIVYSPAASPTSVTVPSASVCSVSINVPFAVRTTTGVVGARWLSTVGPDGDADVRVVVGGSAFAVVPVPVSAAAGTRSAAVRCSVVKSKDCDAVGAEIAAVSSTGASVFGDVVGAGPVEVGPTSVVLGDGVVVVDASSVVVVDVGAWVVVGDGTSVVVVVVVGAAVVVLDVGSVVVVIDVDVGGSVVVVVVEEDTVVEVGASVVVVDVGGSVVVVVVVDVGGSVVVEVVVEVDVGGTVVVVVVDVGDPVVVVVLDDVVVVGVVVVVEDGVAKLRIEPA